MLENPQLYSLIELASYLEKIDYGLYETDFTEYAAKYKLVIMLILRALSFFSNNNAKDIELELLENKCYFDDLEFSAINIYDIIFSCLGWDVEIYSNLEYDILTSDESEDDEDPEEDEEPGDLLTEIFDTDSVYMESFRLSIEDLRDTANITNISVILVKNKRLGRIYDYVANHPMVKDTELFEMIQNCMVMIFSLGSLMEGMTDEGTLNGLWYHYSCYYLDNYSEDTSISILENNPNIYLYAAILNIYMEKAEVEWNIDSI